MYIRFRTEKGETQAVDLIEEIVITTKRIGSSIAALGDWTRTIPERWRDTFAAAAETWSLPPGLLEAVAYRESRFREDIIDGRTRSSAGAVGIMQIIPRWHPEVGEAGALDPARAIPYAAKYLRQNFNRFGSWQLALAAYNWGPANQEKDLLDQIAGNEWPAETRVYVAEISANAQLQGTLA
jgi:soluble lytic murein transglycosylase-like protein